MLANRYLKLVVCLAEVWDVWGPQLSGSSFDLEAEGAHTKRRLSNLLKEKKTFGPVQMLLGDPLRYGLRLWREYNLRAAPRRDPVVPDPKPWAPVDTSEFADWGVPVPDDWGAPFAADWGDLPTDPPADPRLAGNRPSQDATW